jgi:hypothetical protein
MNVNAINNKVARFNGNSYRLIAVNLWGKTLLSAECTFGPNKGQTINNLNADRTKAGHAIKQAVKLGLLS